MIKADGGFDSAIIDPHGRVLQLAVSTKPQRVTPVASVPLGLGNTPSTRWGDWVGWLALAGMAGFACLDVSTAQKDQEGHKLAVGP